MEPSNQQTDELEGTDDPGGGGGDDQNAARLLEQTRQQQQQIDQLRKNVQSNADFLASFMNNTPGMARPSLDPASGHNPVVTSSQASLNPGPTAAAAPPPPPPIQQGDTSDARQGMFALMEAQSRGLMAINPAALHQLQTQHQAQQAQQMMNPAVQNQMLLRNHPQYWDMEPESQVALLQQDPLAMGNMLYQSRGMSMMSPAAITQMPPEVQALFSSHVAPRPMPMSNQQQFPSSSFREKRIINAEKELIAAGNRGMIEPFPEKLHRLLTETQKAGQDDIISFTSDGKAFEIHKPDRFFKEIVPKYFKQSRLSSFKKQLNLYGFEQIMLGGATHQHHHARGGYFHDNFQRDSPEQCRTIRRREMKVTRSRSSKGEMPAPDFYNMQPIAPNDDTKEKVPESTNNTEAAKEA